MDFLLLFIVCLLSFIVEKRLCEKCICISLWQVAALHHCCHYLMKSHSNYTTRLNRCNSLKLIWYDTDATEWILSI